MWAIPNSYVQDLLTHKWIEEVIFLETRKYEVPIWEKLNITVEEAAAYSGIGIHKIRELMKEPDCDFILQIGVKKTLIKRAKFERFVAAQKLI